MSAESPPGQDWGRGHGAAEVAEPGSWGPAWCGGGAPGFPWCQYLRPSAGSSSLLPERPGHSAGSGGEKLVGGAGGAELCCAIYSLVSAGGGVGHQTAPPLMHT